MAKLFTSSIRHPKTFDPITGKTVLIHDIPSINQSISLILYTTKGELFGDPEFGCNLRRMLFNNKGDILIDMIKRDIVSSLLRYEPRVSLTYEDIEITDGDEDHITYKIRIKYRLRYSDYESIYEKVIAEDTYNY